MFAFTKIEEFNIKSNSFVANSLLEFLDAFFQ